MSTEKAPDKNKVIRSFGITNLSLLNRISVLIITLLITFGGLYSYIIIPKESFPEIVIPTIYIGTAYPGNSPVDMENLITRPIEKELKSLTGLKKIGSTSIQDFSTIIVEFNPGVDIPKALQDTKDAVDRAKKDLPTDLDNDPNVFEINFSEFPIMTVNISGDYDLDKLKEFAEYLQDDIEGLSEISSADILGALEREIYINADPFAMAASQVSFSDIETAISNENMSMSAGDLLSDDFRRTIRITGEFQDPMQLQNVIVKKEKDRTVYLRNVATVSDSYQERESYARSGGLPVISLQVVKRSGENLLKAADKITALIETAKAEKLPENVTINITNDQSKFTRNSVNNLENSIISGVILVVLVLLFFMGVRNALFVGMAIPLSMFMAFLVLNFSGVTLNMMVLFGLILALGMLVDNGIVVIENIYRLMQEGYSPLRAAKEGAGEVALPIITSTLTTVAAFVPLAFWQGIIGEFMKYLPITLIIVLSSSLFVALVINPVFASYFMKLDDKAKKGRKKLIIISMIMLLVAVLCYTINLNLLGGLLIVGAFLVVLNMYVLNPTSHWFQEKAMPRLERFYRSHLRSALIGKAPYFYFGGTFAVLILVLMLFGMFAPKIDLFPDNDPQYINVFAELPIGTDIEYTDSVTKIMEKRIFEIMEPYGDAVEAVIANVGAGAGDDMDMGNNITPNRSRITISFVEYEFRDTISTKAIMEDLRNSFNDLAGVEITVDKNQMGPPVGKPINIEVSGEDYDELIALSENLIQTIDNANIHGIEELKMDLETQKPQILMNIDREKARRYGLSTGRIASDLRTALFGKEISKFKEGEDEYEITLKLDDKYRYNLPVLMNQRITFRDQASGNVQQVPISALAELEYSSTYGSVKRKDLDRVITIYSNVTGDGNATQIVGQIQELLSDFEMPAGYDVKFTGEQEEQEKSFIFLVQAMMIAVFAIVLILVSQFNSIIKPLIILFSVIFSTIGVFLGLLVFRMDFIVIMTGIGIISLAGIVVNNAIVLIDYTDLVRKRMRKELGLEEQRLPHDQFVDAIVEGGATRLRPVLLTAITTVLGLIPLATGLNINFYGLLAHFQPDIYWGGDNAAFWGPMAWTVVFGLTFATFLTLVIVPVMYVLSDRLATVFDKSQRHSHSLAEAKQKEASGDEGNLSPATL
ncbi:MAG: efflux RND transporter permease subunit [Bacteroidia bacterium]